MDAATPARRGRRDQKDPRDQVWRALLARTTTQLGVALLRVGAPRRPLRAPLESEDAAVPGSEVRPVHEVLTHCAAYLDHRRGGPVSLETASALAHDGGGFVWVDLSDPSESDIAGVADAFGLPELAVEDAVQAHQRPKLEVYDEVLFVVLKPVVYIDSDEVVDVTEVALFVGLRYVVTVRHGPVPMLDQVRVELDAEEELPVPGPIGVLHRTADLVVDEYESAAVRIDEDVDEIEVQVFADAQDSSDDHSERIYKLKREIAEFRRAVAPLALPLHRLSEGTVSELPPDAHHFFRDVHDHALRAAEAIETHDRLLSDVLQADFARLAARQSQIAVRQNEIAMQQNQDMRRISAWAAIGLVPTAIAGIYGMNFHFMPELRWHYGYFAALAVIATTCTVLYRAFRRNGWL